MSETETERERVRNEGVSSSAVDAVETLVVTKALTASLVMARETLALYVYVGAKKTFAQQKDYSMDALHLSDMWLYLMNMLETSNYEY